MDKVSAVEICWGNRSWIQLPGSTSEAKHWILAEWGGNGRELGAYEIPEE